MSIKHPSWGRLSPKQVAAFGTFFKGSLGYAGMGRVYLLVDLPKKWRKSDPEVVPLSTFFPDYVEDARRELEGMDPQLRANFARDSTEQYIEMVRQAYLSSDQPARTA